VKALEATRPLCQRRTNVSTTQPIFSTPFSLDSLSIPSAFHFKATKSMHNLEKSHFVLEMELMIANIHIESISFRSDRWTSIADILSQRACRLTITTTHAIYTTQTIMKRNSEVRSVEK
jgi:hypothetical protein